VRDNWSRRVRTGRVMSWRCRKFKGTEFVRRKVGHLAWNGKLNDSGGKGEGLICNGLLETAN